MDTWLADAPLRPSTKAEYRREVLSWLTWCRQQKTDPYTVGPGDIAAWSQDVYLEPFLGGRSFDGPDALAELAAHHPDVARSHDRRITALTLYYEAAVAKKAIQHPPNLAALRSGVPRDPGDVGRLTPRERAIFLSVVGSWGPDRSVAPERDRLLAYLLLNGLRPAQAVRLDLRYMHQQPDYSFEVNVPDEHDAGAGGRQLTLDPLVGAAIQHYLPKRPQPHDGIHTLLVSRLRRPLRSRFCNELIQAMCALHPLLAERHPPVTADVIAHTGLWDEPTGS